MPRIDALLTAMLSNRAESVRLTDGDVAHLMIGGTPQPLTRQPLAPGQLVALLQEIVPADMAPRLHGNSSLDFIYVNDTGRFVTRIRRDGEKMRATLAVAPAETNGSSKDAPSSAVSGNGSSSHSGNGRNDTDAATMTVAEPVPSGAAEAEDQRPAVVRAAWSISGPPLGTGVAMPSPPAPREVPPREVVESDVASGPAQEEIDRLLKAQVDQAASDLHLRVGEAPILRIHGELRRIRDTDALSNARLEAMFATIMPERNLAEYRERNDTDFAYEIPDLARFRVNLFRDHHGAAGVFRVIPAKVATVEELGITPEVQNLCSLTKGLVLVTGPTGSGKSTTLGALVDLINRSRDEHVITIEDPIEFVHRNKRCVITQRQVGMHTASFKSALRAALREDPDIMLVGELRDLETASIALETAETGHLVFGTLHTTSAVGTIDRLIDQFPPDRQAQIRVMLADSLRGVVSQCLCRKIGGGRVAAREILLTNPAVANLIREGKAYQLQSVMQTSRKLGMVLLGDVLLELVENGTVEPREAYTKANDKPAFMLALKNRGHDTSFLMS